MKKIFSTLLIGSLLFITNSIKAQTALPLAGIDCNGMDHDLFADLDAGKASILFFFMESCSSCPPVAKKVQFMANNILAQHPNMIKAYAMPYNNTTTCSYTSGWVTSNNLNLFSPYDSGTVQVAHYGGFGMPTVVLVGGADHRTMFSTLSFTTSDTTIMRDSILALLGSASTGINQLPNTISSFNVYPNPVTSNMTISLEMIEPTNVEISIVDITGKTISNLYADKNIQGTLTKEFNLQSIANGLYTIHIVANGKTINKSINVLH